MYASSSFINLAKPTSKGPDQEDWDHCEPVSLTLCPSFHIHLHHLTSAVRASIRLTQSTGWPQPKQA